MQHMLWAEDFGFILKLRFQVTSSTPRAGHRGTCRSDLFSLRGLRILMGLRTLRRLRILRGLRISRGFRIQGLKLWA